LVANSTSAGTPAVLRRRSSVIHTLGITERCDEGVAERGGVGQVDRYLCVLDPPRGARVLTLDTDGEISVLQVAGLVDHDHRVGLVQVLAQMVVDIAHTAGEQIGQEFTSAAVSRIRPGSVGRVALQPHQLHQHHDAYLHPAGFPGRERPRHPPPSDRRCGRRASFPVATALLGPAGRRSPRSVPTTRMVCRPAGRPRPTPGSSRQPAPNPTRRSGGPSHTMDPPVHGGSHRRAPGASGARTHFRRICGLI
jgi:hypothetical protein